MELKLAASTNQSLTRFRVHSFVSNMLRSVSLGSSPTRLREYRGGYNGSDRASSRLSGRTYVGAHILKV
jgi:hypothetical protein